MMGHVPPTPARAPSLPTWSTRADLEVFRHFGKAPCTARSPIARETRDRPLTQALGPEPRRQLGRADDVDEHARHEAALLADGRHGRAVKRELGVAFGEISAIVTAHGGTVEKYLDRHVPRVTVGERSGG